MEKNFIAQSGGRAARSAARRAGFSSHSGRAGLSGLPLTARGAGGPGSSPGGARDRRWCRAARSLRKRWPCVDIAIRSTCSVLGHPDQLGRPDRPSRARVSTREARGRRARRARPSRYARSAFISSDSRSFSSSKLRAAQPSATCTSSSSAPVSCASALDVREDRAIGRASARWRRGCGGTWAVLRPANDLVEQPDVQRGNDNRDRSTPAPSASAGSTNGAHLVRGRS